jgi:hypothetical protein
MQSSEIGDERPVAACAFAPDGATLATASWSGRLKLWRAPGSEKLLTVQAHDTRITGASTSASNPWQPNCRQPMSSRPHRSAAACPGLPATVPQPLLARADHAGNALHHWCSCVCQQASSGSTGPVSSYTASAGAEPWLASLQGWRGTRTRSRAACGRASAWRRARQTAPRGCGPTRARCCRRSAATQTGDGGHIVYLAVWQSSWAGRTVAVEHSWLASRCTARDMRWPLHYADWGGSPFTQWATT